MYSENTCFRDNSENMTSWFVPYSINYLIYLKPTPTFNS